MATILIIARLFHIGGGIFWVGAVLTAVFFLEPTAKAMGAEGSAFMGHLIRRRRLTSVMGAAAIMSIGAGAVLYWVISGGLRAEWLTSGPGMAYGVGGAAALVAFLIALVLLKPGYDRIAAIAEEAAAQGAEASAAAQREVEDLEARLRPWGLTQAALLAVTVVGMAVGRYVH